MAIDPATAKIIAQMALKVVSDEEMRKRIIIIALIPVISVLLILTMFQYLITHPWEFFESVFTGGNSTEIKQFHDKYYIEPRESDGVENKSSNDGYESEKTEGEHEEENLN